MTAQDESLAEAEELEIGFIGQSDVDSVPRCTGTVNGQRHPILLDTGARGIFVDQRLIRSDQYTGQHVLVRFVEGTPQRRAIALVEFDCPYYQGLAPVIALEDPTHPVYLGRVQQLSPRFRQAAYDQAISEWSITETPEPPVDPVVVTEVPESDAAAVSTRSSNRPEEAPPPEDVPLQPILAVRKKDGRHRFCLDSRPLNTRTVIGGNVEGVSVYIDDVSIYSETWEERCKISQEVRRCLRQHGLHLKSSEWENGCQSNQDDQALDDYHGRGMQTPVEGEAEVIQDLAVPRTVAELRSFLGSIRSHQSSIPRCNARARPLYKLLRGNPAKTKPIVWNDEAGRAFVSLKEAYGHLLGVPQL